MKKTENRRMYYTTYYHHIITIKTWYSLQAVDLTIFFCLLQLLHIFVAKVAAAAFCSCSSLPTAQLELLQLGLTTVRIFVPGFVLSILLLLWSQHPTQSSYGLYFLRKMFILFSTNLNVRMQIISYSWYATGTYMYSFY